MKRSRSSARLMFILLLSLLVLASGPLTNSIGAAQSNPWAAVSAAIEASPLTDLVVIVGDAKGERYTYSKGFGRPDFPGVQVASASKWWAGALLLTLVEEGVLSLSDAPHKYIPWWTSAAEDKRSQITLEHLLSMTAGFRGEPLCVLDPRSTLEACAKQMYEGFHRDAPGTAFHYNSSHMQIAGLMAEKATGKNITTLFEEKIGRPLKFQQGTNFWRASAQNSWLAGGGNASPRDYARYLQALMAGEIIPKSLPVMLKDRTADPVRILASPISALTEWHYGLGVWKECTETKWPDEICNAQQVYSSPGGLGWYPWIDFGNGYYGVLARQGKPRSNALLDSGALVFQLRPLIIEALKNGG